MGLCVTESQRRARKTRLPTSSVVRVMDAAASGTMDTARKGDCRKAHYPVKPTCGREESTRLLPSFSPVLFRIREWQRRTGMKGRPSLSSPVRTCGEQRQPWPPRRQ